MNIAINPEAPEYVARITLKPKTEEDMKVVNKYKQPLMSGSTFLVLSVLSIAAGLIFGVN